MDLNDLLLGAVKAGATDVHLNLGRPPILRRDGSLVPAENVQRPVDALSLRGLLYHNNSSKLCGGVSGSECAFSTWNPNNELLTIVTDWHGGFAGTGNGILIDNNAQFQGGLFATYDVEFISNSRSDGPIVGRRSCSPAKAPGFPAR